MAVELEIANNQRYGTFDIRGIKGTFPTQAITSTNLYQRKAALQSDKLSQATKSAFRELDFETRIVEMIEFDPHGLVGDPEYREAKIKSVSKMIGENPGRLSLFTLQGIRSYMPGTGLFRFPKDTNRALIDFQLECGFDLIRVFFNTRQNVMDHSYYRDLVPDGRFLACLDENMVNEYFRTAYLDCLGRGDEMISFFGRSPNNKTNQHNRHNFLFITHRPRDRIVRTVSSIQKSTGELVNSLHYKLRGLDAMSFMTKRGNPNYRNFVPKALDVWKYRPLLPDTRLRCVITNQNLFDATREFRFMEKSSDGEHNAVYDGSTIPISVHDIVRLNQQLRVSHERYTWQQLNRILEGGE